MPCTFVNTDFVTNEKACLHYSDLAIQRGYGVFDFCKVVNGHPAFLRQHLDRFLYSAAQLRLPIEKSKEELAQIITTLIEKNAIVHSGIRLTLTGGCSVNGYDIAKPNLIIAQQHFQPLTPTQVEKGICLVSHEHQRQLPHVKSIDYLMAIYLQSCIKEQQADDVLYHCNGRITECPRSNFFIVDSENCIITPKENILKGITRHQLLTLAANEFAVEERNIGLDEVLTASEAFVTSTTKAILPVQAINKKTIGNGSMGSVTRRLLQLWQSPAS